MFCFLKPKVVKNMSDGIEKSDYNPSFISFTSVPFKIANSKIFDDMKYNYFDVELNNLKRAYDVFLEPSDSKSLNCSKRESAGDDENARQDSVKFSEKNKSSVEEKDASLQTNKNDQDECSDCSCNSTIPYLQEHCEARLLGFIDSSSTHFKMQQLNFENQLSFKKGIFCCQQCGKQFIQHDLLLAHMQDHDKRKCFKCPTGDRVFPTHQYLVQHLERHEKEVEVKKEVSEQIFKCSTCEKCFRKKESMIKHSRIHTRDLLKCSLCDFTCSKKVALKMHVVSHEGNRKYKCDRCDFSFKQIGHLKRHIARFKH